MTARVRPRPAWEAVDLGFMMLQRGYRQVITSWLLITLPVCILLNAGLFHHPFLAGLIFWWLLPVFDRIPLHILSRALFGEMVSTRSLLKAWREIFLPHAIKMLTIYRLDFSRSYNLPVWQLERLSGRERAQRSRVLKKSQATNAIGLGFICLGVELILFLSLYGLMMMLLPSYYEGQLVAALFHHGRTWWAGPLANGFLYLTFLLVEPFYVAGGFSLYINRRTRLEGWDIEINFRQLAQRAASLARQAILLLGCFIVLHAGLLYSRGAQAAPLKQVSNVQASDATNNAVARKAINAVMQDKAFHHRVTVGGWRLRHSSKAQSGSNKKASGLHWLVELGNTLAQLGQLVLWVLVATLVVGLIYVFSKWMPARGEGKFSRPGRAMPKSMFGLDITPESLPDDVGNTASELWRAGKLVEALSLLYRGALAIMVHRDGINLRGSATEGDCIRMVNQHSPQLVENTADYFRLLTRQWQYVAYGHRRPDDMLMNELCGNWRQYFGAVE